MMAEAKENPDERVVTLRALYVRDEVAKNILDYFASRTKNTAETTVDRLDAKINGASRASIEEVLRTFEELKLGKFAQGRTTTRGNYKTRFFWYFSLISVGKVAKHEAEKFVELPAYLLQLHQVETPDPEVLVEPKSIATPRVVSFPLRLDFDVELKVPLNMRAWEAEAICKWIKLLPVADGSRPAA